MIKTGKLWCRFYFGKKSIRKKKLWQTKYRHARNHKHVWIVDRINVSINLFYHHYHYKTRAQSQSSILDVVFFSLFSFSIRINKHGCFDSFQPFIFCSMILIKIIWKKRVSFKETRDQPITLLHTNWLLIVCKQNVFMDGWMERGWESCRQIKT